ncbi:hemolysin family protein [Gorillibacterium massiliense]|uniref:hemolysin family protein n=1 Tax=Gorillibacterium massiliense TaxID=1280390 RepID=UPI0004B4E56D|nr:hemolysin family protein [Gorillibacterium massiliense]
MESFDFGKIALYLALVLFLVLLNGIFVAAEFALVKIRQTRIQELINEGKSKAKYAMAVTKQLDTYLSATQLGITLASLAIGYVGEPALGRLIFEPMLERLHIQNDTLSTVLSFILTFCTITFLHIVLGEQAPKNLAIQKAEGASLWLSGPLIVFTKIFKPIIWLLNSAANGLLRLFGVEPGSEHEAHTEEEIRILMNQSAKSGHINKDELVLFDNIFEFSDRLAREVMLPRTDMECLYTDVSMQENMEVVYKTKHTRYPVAVEEKDQIIGFVHITDLLTLPSNKLLEVDLREIVRPILTVPESMEISRVLKLMQKKHSQLAIVIDEYGGTAGLLTIEEILEEIVGEIQDEFDNERPDIEDKGQYVSVAGRVLLEELKPLLDITVEDEEVDSVGGWLFKKLEGNPVKGARVDVKRYIFEVAETDRLRITWVNIYKVEVPEEANQNGTDDEENRQ